MLLLKNKRLPNDISNKIFTYIDINSIQVLNNIKYLIYPNHKKNFISFLEYIASSRIKIFILIKLNYYSFKIFILKKISNFFGKDFYNNKITCFRKIKYYKEKYKSKCILCRICNNLSNTHPFSENFINKYYCPFLY